MRFFCIDDEVPDETIRLLEEASAARAVDFVPVEASCFDYDSEARPQPGDLLYRPAVSAAAILVEEFLFIPGAATFYTDPLGPFFRSGTAPFLFMKSGLPVPRSYYLSVVDPDLLRAFVEHLGGFPVVLKVSGGEGGVGVMRADSYPALFSICDYALSQGQHPLLMSYVPDATHWRVVVVGERAVAAYRNTTNPDDFRTYSGDDPADYTAEPSQALGALAVKAARALRLEFAGVDVLEHASGRLYVLEANFPCYFPQAQLVAGIDIAGAMLDHLIAKADKIQD
jgi:hypothetical protein